MARKRTRTSQRAVCERFVEECDVLGLFEYIRAQRVPLPPDVSLGGLGRCIRSKARCTSGSGWRKLTNPQATRHH